MIWWIIDFIPMKHAVPQSNWAAAAAQFGRELEDSAEYRRYLAKSRHFDHIWRNIDDISPNLTFFATFGGLSTIFRRIFLACFLKVHYTCA